MSMPDYTAQAALTRELSAGEHLLWSGRPRQGLIFRTGDIYMVPFSLLWGGFAFYIEYNILTSSSIDIFSAILVGAFVIMGFYIIAGRFIVDISQRSRTYYGVTTQRALILSGAMTRQIRSVSLQKLDEISLDERWDGCGSIFFGSMSNMNRIWRGTSWPEIGDDVPVFERIDNVRQVYGIVQQVQRSK
jgi:hypothetical protein